MLQSCVRVPRACSVDVLFLVTCLKNVCVVKALLDWDDELDTSEEEEIVISSDTEEDTAVTSSQVNTT